MLNLCNMTEEVPHRRHHVSFEAAAAALQQIVPWGKVKQRLGQLKAANHSLTAAVETPVEAPSSLPTPIVIYSISDLRAALLAAEETGFGLSVITAPGIASTLGPRWFTAMLARLQDDYPETPLLAIMDCGDREGVAMAALQHGVPAIYFKGHPTSTQKLQWMARKVKAEFFNQLGPKLDLLENSDSYEACYAWLKTNGTPIPEAAAVAR